MRLMLTVVAVAALAGCGSKPDDNRAVAAGPETAAAAPAGTSIAASFDCATADGQVQELICADSGLAAMDREVVRLAALAPVEPADRAEWAKQRDKCWKDDELRRCTLVSLAVRIHQLRRDHVTARERDGEGISLGPTAYRCAGLDTPLAATFINSDPGAVVIEWGKKTEVLDQAVAASGARYQARGEDGTWQFWIKGREATLTRPDKTELGCADPTADDG